MDNPNKLDKEEDVWIAFAINNNYKFILVLKDLDDLDLYPVYFYYEWQLEKYKNNIISATRVKIIKILKVRFEE